VVWPIIAGRKSLAEEDTTVELNQDSERALGISQKRDVNRCVFSLGR
jgi:hypothetical protein